MNQFGPVFPAALAIDDNPPQYKSIAATIPHHRGYQDIRVVRFRMEPNGSLDLITPKGQALERASQLVKERFVLQPPRIRSRVRRPGGPANHLGLGPLSAQDHTRPPNGALHQTIVALLRKKSSRQNQVKPGAVKLPTGRGLVLSGVEGSAFPAWVACPPRAGARACPEDLPKGSSLAVFLWGGAGIPACVLSSCSSCLS